MMRGIEKVPEAVALIVSANLAVCRADLLSCECCLVEAVKAKYCGNAMV